VVKELIFVWNRRRIHFKQLDLEIPVVITILKDLGIYTPENNEEIGSNASNPNNK
jgi:hypothetical protein